MEDFCHTKFLQFERVIAGDRTTHDDQHIRHIFFAQQFHNSRHNRFVSARQNGEANDLHILLESRVNNHLRRLPKTSVDDFHPRITKGSCDHLRAAVVSIEARFGDEDTDRKTHTNANPSIERRKTESEASPPATRLSKRELRQNSPQRLFQLCAADLPLAALRVDAEHLFQRAHDLAGSGVAFHSCQQRRHHVRIGPRGAFQRF